MVGNHAWDALSWYLELLPVGAEVLAVVKLVDGVDVSVCVVAAAKEESLGAVLAKELLDVEAPAAFERLVNVLADVDNQENEEKGEEVGGDEETSWDQEKEGSRVELGPAPHVAVRPSIVRIMPVKLLFTVDGSLVLFPRVLKQEQSANTLRNEQREKHAVVISKQVEIEIKHSKIIKNNTDVTSKLNLRRICTVSKWCSKTSHQNEISKLLFNRSNIIRSQIYLN